jgi:hypothetical protein
LSILVALCAYGGQLRVHDPVDITLFLSFFLSFFFFGYAMQGIELSRVFPFFPPGRLEARCQPLALVFGL